MPEIEEASNSSRLSNGQIHVRPVWLRASDEDVALGEAALSQHERQRAETLRFAHLRRNFLLAHGCLRALLGSYLDIAASDVRVGVKSGGKPCLESSTSDLRFNQSDSGDLAVFAFSAGRELGVDIEAVRAVSDLELLASRFFAREETDELLGLPREQRTRAFFAAWTRKEAYVKAIGQGLQVPLNQTRVTLRPQDPPSLIHIAGDRQAAWSWHVYSFEPAHAYMGAVVYQGDGMEVQVFTTTTASDILKDAL